MMSCTQKKSSPASQRGAALIVSLILLALLTVIAVSGFQSTLLQERMVGSMRDRQLALQSAEAALRYAEAQIKAAATVADVPNAIVHKSTDNLIRKINDNVISEETYWNTEENWKRSEVKSYPAETLQGLTEVPQYVIEQLPEDFSCINGSVCMEQKLKEKDHTYVIKQDAQVVTDFRVTARAQGAKEDGAVIILQTVYRRVD